MRGIGGKGAAVVGGPAGTNIGVVPTAPSSRSRSAVSASRLVQLPRT